MAGKNDQQSNQHPEATFIVMCLVLAGVAYLLWHFFSGYIIRGMFPIQWLQIKLIEYTSGIGQTGRNVLEFVESTITGDQDAWTIGIVDFWTIRTIVGERIQWPMVGLTLVFAAILIKRSMRSDKFKAVLSLNSFMEYNAQHWRTSLFSVKFDPDKDWPEMKPQKSPGEWVRDNGIKYEKGDLDIAKAEGVMLEQLGSLWQGQDNLPLHIEAMFAIMGAHMIGHPGSGGLRGDLTVTYTLQKDVEKRDAQVKALIAPFIADEKVKEAINSVAAKHAWTSTILIEFFEQSRSAQGVLATAEFLWLKSIDRPLYYVLNNVGRRAFHVEGSGAICHYFYEKRASRSLPDPKFDKALEGIVYYLKEERGVEDLSTMPD